MQQHRHTRMTTAEREAAELVAARVLLPVPDVIHIILATDKCTRLPDPPVNADHICRWWLELTRAGGRFGQSK
jgi:hypothetical protein